MKCGLCLSIFFLNFFVINCAFSAPRGLSQLDFDRDIKKPSADTSNTRSIYVPRRLNQISMEQDDDTRIFEEKLRELKKLQKNTESEKPTPSDHTPEDTKFENPRVNAN